MTKTSLAAKAAWASAGGLTAAAAVHVSTYPLWRRRCLTWGARPDEVDAQIPGDEMLIAPDIISTRAVTIESRPASIWPWLVQMGPGRGGAYTYDWIENLFGLGMHSANAVLPQFQDLHIGDGFKLGARGPVLRVAVIEPEAALAFRSDDQNWIWAFALRTDGMRTRLISRNRISTPGVSPVTRAMYRYLMEPGSLIMERKMLLGIKQRAEHLASTTA